MPNKYKIDAYFLTYPEVQFKFVLIEEVGKENKTLCVKASNLDTVLLEREIDVTNKDITNVSITEMIYEQYLDFMKSSVWEKFLNANFEISGGFRPIFLNGNDGDERFKKFSEAPSFDTAKEAVDWSEDNLTQECEILEILNSRGISVLTIEIEN